MSNAMFLLTFLLFTIYNNGIKNPHNQKENIDTDKKNDLKEMNLKGKVKQITESSFFAEDKFGEITKDGPPNKTIIFFNDNGNIIEKNCYLLDGTTLATKHIYNYDDKKLKKEELVYVYHASKSKLLSKYTFEYDVNENRTKSYYHYKDITGPDIYSNTIDKLGIYETYKYDDKGNLIEKYNYPNGYHFLEPGPSSVDYYKYDDKGNIIVEERYNSDGSFSWRHEYKYVLFDKFDNWLKKILYCRGGACSIFEREIEYY